MKNCSFDRMTKVFPAKINDTDKREHVLKIIFTCYETPDYTQ